MIQLNPRYEVIFDPENIDQDCDRIAGMMSDEGDFIKEALDAGLYKQAARMYLQLLKAADKREESQVHLVYPEREQARPKVKSMCKHFAEDEHYCYFDDMYSPEYTMQWIYEAIQKHDIDAESQALLEEGHKEILQSECYEDYGYPPYLDR